MIGPIAAIMMLTNQTFTAICGDSGHFFGVAAALAAVLCWKRSANWSATGFRPGIVLTAAFT
jgi:hypothetical protein